MTCPGHWRIRISDRGSVLLPHRSECTGRADAKHSAISKGHCKESWIEVNIWTEKSWQKSLFSFVSLPQLPTDNLFLTLIMPLNAFPVHFVSIIKISFLYWCPFCSCSSLPQGTLSFLPSLDTAAGASNAVSSALLPSTLLCFSVTSQHFKGFRPSEKAQKAETQFTLRLAHCHLVNLSWSSYYIIKHAWACNRLLYLSNWLNGFHRDNLEIQALWTWSNCMCTAGVVIPSLRHKNWK